MSEEKKSQSPLVHFDFGPNMVIVAGSIRTGREFESTPEGVLIKDHVAGGEIRIKQGETVELVRIVAAVNTGRMGFYRIAMETDREYRTGDHLPLVPPMDISW